MNSKDIPKDIEASELIKAEIPLIKKIINDETWYEGERRHSPVSSEDDTVKRKVLDIIQREGDKILSEAIMSVKTSGHKKTDSK